MFIKGVANKLAREDIKNRLAQRYDENSIQEKHQDEHVLPSNKELEDEAKYPKHHNTTKLKYPDKFSLILDSPSYESKMIEGTIEAMGHVPIGDKKYANDIEKLIIGIFNKSGFSAESMGIDEINYIFTIKVDDELFENVMHNGSFEETDGKINIFLDYIKN